jgi:DNA-binding transcriptional LysR family regulator
MHRYAHRLFADLPARFTYSADGTEIGKLMVAEGLGAAILPDYGVVGDPLERSGAIVVRELDDDAEVIVVIQRRLRRSATGVAHDLHEMFLECGRAFMASA